MDSSTARKLFEECAVFIAAGVPVGTKFGIDLCAYNVGEDFRGVKMIPPGPHFIWCASSGPYGDVAPRVGFVHYFTGKEIVVREWDNENEELRERKIAEPALEIQRIRENLRELDRFLAPYDYKSFGEWKHLTDTITRPVLERCRPALGTIRTCAELQSCPDSERPRGVRKEIYNHNSNTTIDEDELLPKLKPIEGTAPRFTQLPERVPKNSQPAEVSLHSMDCVVAVNTLVAAFSDSNTIIEELQLSFILFMVGFSIESLSHWRKALHLLSHSETAVGKFKHLYMKLSEVLAFQLPHLPEELMEATNHNLVYKDVRSLVINLNLGGLTPSADHLLKRLKKSMKWQFEGLLEEDPEDMPVVVDLV